MNYDREFWDKIELALPCVDCGEDSNECECSEGTNGTDA